MDRKKDKYQQKKKEENLFQICIIKIMQLLFLQRDHYCLCSITQLLFIIKGLSFVVNIYNAIPKHLCVIFHQPLNALLNRKKKSRKNY